MAEHGAVVWKEAQSANKGNEDRRGRNIALKTSYTPLLFSIHLQYNTTHKTKTEKRRVATRLDPIMIVQRTAQNVFVFLVVSLATPISSFTFIKNTPLC